MRAAHVITVASLAALTATAGLAPVLVAGPASAVTTTIVLTPAQATAALSTAIRVSAARLLATGGTTNEYSYGPPGPGQSTYRTVVVLDRSARRARVQQTAGGVIQVLAHVVVDPCASDTGPYDRDRTAVNVEEPDVGTWTRIGAHPTPAVRGGLALLHRTGVRWVFERNHSNSLTSIVEQQSAISYLTKTTLDNYTYTGGTQTTTSAGTSDVLTYRDPFLPPSQDLGQVHLTLDGDGTIVRVVDDDGVDIPSSEYVDESVFTYARESVSVPAERTQITRAALVPGCIAIATRTDVAALASGTVANANAATPGHVSPAVIRTWVQQLEQTKYRPGEQVTVSRITDGVEIVGRDHLLPHPTVWTVIARHGTADARRIR